MDGGVLEEPLAETKEVIIEQRHGTVKQQAWDGRVLVELDTVEAEDEFAHTEAGCAEKRKPPIGHPTTWWPGWSATLR